jgi:phage terminase Nu1 subunit (DNA packaging protein)
MSAKYNERVSASVIAGFLGVSSVAFSNLVGRGVVPRGGREGYPLRSTLQLCFAHYRKLAAGRSPDDDSMATLTAARARVASAQAKEHELPVAERQGRVISRLVIRAKWEQLAISFREVALGVAGKISNAC